MEFAKYAAVPRNVQEDMVAKYKAKSSGKQIIFFQSLFVLFKTT